MTVVLDLAKDSLILLPLIWLRRMDHLKTLRLFSIIALLVGAQAA